MPQTTRTEPAETKPGICAEHVPFRWNRDVLSIHTLAHILIGELASTSPGYALMRRRRVARLVVALHRGGPQRLRGGRRRLGDGGRRHRRSGGSRGRVVVAGALLALDAAQAV